MWDFLIVGLGGFLGCCCRFGITKMLTSFQTEFPFATLISNVIAGMLIGFIAGMENQMLWLTPKRKLFLTTGMLGGLSTFSTFSLETVTLFSRGKYLHAAGNILSNVTFSLIGVLLGFGLAKWIIKKTSV